MSPARTALDSAWDNAETWPSDLGLAVTAATAASIHEHEAGPELGIFMAALGSIASAIVMVAIAAAVAS